MIKKKTTRTYLIHDNGGRPFKVVIKGKKAFISVITDLNAETYKSKLEIPFIQDFIGIDNFHKIIDKKILGYTPTPTTKTKGNSILLQVKSDKPEQYKYVYVGSEIYSFYTNEIINKYYSPIGNNDVPYPYVISENYIYLLLEKTILNKEAVQTKDPYQHYYFMEHAATKLKPKKLRTKSLVKRLYGP